MGSLKCNREFHLARGVALGERDGGEAVLVGVHHGRRLAQLAEPQPALGRDLYLGVLHALRTQHPT
jgi:hypothetical protein